MEATTNAIEKLFKLEDTNNNKAISKILQTIKMTEFLIEPRDNL